MYEYTDEGIVKQNGNRDPEQLSNFTAQIIEEIQFVDGKASTNTLRIEGMLGEEKLPPVDVPAEKFASMSWVTPSWGVGAVICPIANAERDLRAAIQLNSTPIKTTVYMHLGWTKIGKQHAYLTAEGAIGEKGLNEKVKVRLPHELNQYKIRPATDDATRRDAIVATLNLRRLAEPKLIWPMIIATIRPVIGPVDYAMHVAGRTGTFKSELASIMQSHYGEEMDARRLPGSWSSTANALEAQCYKAKNALFVIDDFVPYGTSYQVRQYQKAADQMFRGQGNQAGRARLTDVSSLQETMYPRGLIFSTGEDIPTGHSIRARMMIIELTPGDIRTDHLSEAQKMRSQYSVALGSFIEWIAAQDHTAVVKLHKERAKEMRQEFLEIGHTRTPAMIADMIATIAMFTCFAQDVKAISSKRAEEINAEAKKAVMEIANEQLIYLESQDPTDAFMLGLKMVFDTKVGHLRACDGGIPPNPEEFGWTKKEAIGSIATYTAHGPKIGWVDSPKDSVYLDPHIAFAHVLKAARGGITITKQTMFKRLKDAGLLNATDTQRSRNSIRVQCEGRTQAVLSFQIATVINNQESANV